ncbi:MAG: homoserine dehydrogenase [Planctomycetota bacterium]
MKTIHVGLVGFGTVGSGVVKILLEEHDAIAERTNVDVRLLYVCDLDLARDRGVAVPKGLLTKDFRKVLDDDRVSVVIELIGGIDVAKKLILEALAKKKHVVTANKALLATHGTQLFEAAAANGVTISFEASCAGGIPIILALREGFVANRILSIMGIVNGTCNYILTRMAHDRTNYNEALAGAQAQGYAETPPTLDVSGVDSAHKLAILAKTAFGVDFDFDEITCEGIDEVRLQDIEYAAELGYVLKLLAIAKRSDHELELRVHPTLIDREHPLASVGGVFNAVALEGHAVGEALLYGRGAGQMPTASAVCADILDVALGRAKLSFDNLALYPGKGKRVRVKPIGEIVTRYYLRFTVVDRPGVLAQIAGVLGKNGISILSVIQKEAGTETVPLVIMTHAAKEARMASALAEIEKLEVVRDKTVMIRVEKGEG